MSVNLDKSSADAARLIRLTDEPWRAETGDIVALAQRKDLTLSERDIKGRAGDYTIDGMEWYQWLDAMASDDQ